MIKLHEVRTINRPLEEVFAGFKGKIVFHEDPSTPTTEDWEDA